MRHARLEEVVSDIEDRNFNEEVDDWACVLAERYDEIAQHLEQAQSACDLSIGLFHHCALSWVMLASVSE